MFLTWQISQIIGESLITVSDQLSTSATSETVNSLTNIIDENTQKDIENTLDLYKGK